MSYPGEPWTPKIPRRPHVDRTSTARRPRAGQVHSVSELYFPLVRIIFFMFDAFFLPSPFASFLQNVHIPIVKVMKWTPPRPSQSIQNQSFFSTPSFPTRFSAFLLPPWSASFANIFYLVAQMVILRLFENVHIMQGPGLFSHVTGRLVN